VTELPSVAFSVTTFFPGQSPIWPGFFVGTGAVTSVSAAPFPTEPCEGALTSIFGCGERRFASGRYPTPSDWVWGAGWPAVGATRRSRIWWPEAMNLSGARERPAKLIDLQPIA